MDVTVNTGIEIAVQSIVPTSLEDYPDEKTGLMMCGKCREAKQHRLKNGSIVPCICRCQRESWEQRDICRKQAEFQNLVKKLRDDGIPDSHLQTKTFAPSQETEKLKKMRSYIDHYGEMRKEKIGMLFIGCNGCGKTHIAACVANALIDRGISAQIFSLSRLLLYPIGDHAAMIRNALRKEFLVIDDFRAERQTPYVLEVAFALIDARINMGKNFIITTNLTMEMLRNPPDLGRKRIYDRILEGCQPMIFPSKNYREDIHAAKREVLSRIMPYSG